VPAIIERRQVDRLEAERRPIATTDVEAKRGGTVDLERRERFGAGELDHDGLISRRESGAGTAVEQRPRGESFETEDGTPLRQRARRLEVRMTSHHSEQPQQQAMMRVSHGSRLPKLDPRY